MSMSKRFILAVAALAVAASSFATAPTKNPVVELDIAKRGKVQIELFSKEAPKTVEHFVGLVKKGFYNGIRFHRVVPRFVVQAGDPKSAKLSDKDSASRDDGEGGTIGVGDGGSGKVVPFEKNSLTHQHGAVSMALSAPASDTGDSQFFINLKENGFLNGNYCVFGKVVKGLDVVAKIRRGDVIVKAKLVAGVKPKKR